MHEMAITQSILDIVLSHANQNGAKRVSKIVLTFGAMSMVVGDCVRFYFDIISKNTLAEGAELEIIDVPVRIKCAQCNKVYESQDPILICPECQSMISDIVSGKELDVTSIIIEDGEKDNGG